MFKNTYSKEHMQMTSSGVSMIMYRQFEVKNLHKLATLKAFFVTNFLSRTDSNNFLKVNVWWVLFSLFLFCHVLTLKKLGGGRGINLTPLPVIFPKIRVKSWFFVTYNIIISHIFAENFIEMPQVVQKIWRFSPSILTIFIVFFRFFDNTLLQRD